MKLKLKREIIKWQIQTNANRDKGAENMTKWTPNNNKEEKKHPQEQHQKICKQGKYYAIWRGIADDDWFRLGECCLI